jgi:excisionase family DNA binding protein
MFWLCTGKKGPSLEGKEPMLMIGEEKEKEKEKLYTVAEVASRLRVDQTTVRRWIKGGSLRAITLPHKGKRQAYRITQTGLNEALKTNLSV